MKQVTKPYPLSQNIGNSKCLKKKKKEENMGNILINNQQKAKNKDQFKWLWPYKS